MKTHTGAHKGTHSDHRHDKRIKAIPTPTPTVVVVALAKAGGEGTHDQ